MEGDLKNIMLERQKKAELRYKGKRKQKELEVKSRIKSKELLTVKEDTK